MHGNLQGRRPYHHAWLGSGLIIMLSWVLQLTISVCAHAAKESSAIEAILVLDSSGSMKRNDPKNLRIPAAKLFISLLSPQDSVGVISFSDQGYPVIGLTPLNSNDSSNRLFQAVEKISSKGAYTNLHDALDKAHGLLLKSGAENVKRYIILMSDGKMDVGDQARDKTLTRRITQELLPRLQQDNIRVYSIAFTEASDITLLQAVAQESKGMFSLAKTDKDLHGVFTSIFESSKNPDMLPVEGGQFVADETIDEVSIVASKENSSIEILLQDPNEKRYSNNDKPENMKWFASENFDLITISKPSQGTWQLLSTEDKNKAYIITDLGLDTNITDSDLPLNSELSIQLWLVRAGETVMQEDLLVNTQFTLELEQPNGIVTSYTLHDNGKLGDAKANDGIYTTLTEFFKQGQYQLRLIAKSQTFQREVKRFFQVNAKAVLPPEVQPQEPEPEPVVEVPPKEEVPTVIPEPDTLAQQPPQEEKQFLNIWLLLGIFILFNVVLGSIIMLVIILKKSGKSSDSDSTEDETETTAKTE